MKKIKLSDKNIVLVDNSDYEFAKRFNLVVSTGGTVMVVIEWNKKRVDIPLYHLIFRPPGKMEAFFKNKNKLDFRKENISFVDQSQLNHSVRLNYKNVTGKTSKYRGVSSINEKNKYLTDLWRAQICHNGKRYGKRFATEEEAALWYNEKARELFGDLAYQNEIK